jgi:arylformamidase
MRLFDISVPLSNNTPTYPGDPKFQIQQWLSLENGDSANVSMLHFGAHTGTHIDAPAHFIHGAAKVDSVPLELLIGAAEVIEVPRDCLVIDEKFVREHVRTGTKRVLFKTRNSEFWQDNLTTFQIDYTSLSNEAATLLAQLNVNLVGIDYLSIEKFQSESFETHLNLLSHGIVILEGLDLSNVPAGRYELICLPLRIAGGDGDGAPARAVLRQHQTQ